MCGRCEPRLTVCATCRDGGYTGRAFTTEQMIREIMELRQQPADS